MKLSAIKFVPDKIISGTKYEEKWQKEYAKSEALASLFGSDELSKKEVIETLRRENVVSDGLIGRIKAEIILHSKFPTGSSMWYEFVKVRTVGGDDTKYRLKWIDDNTPG